MGADRAVSPAEPLVLPFQRPFNAGAMLAAMAAHSVPGVERTDPEARTHSCAVRSPSGPAVVTVTFHDDHVAVSSVPGIEDRSWLSATARRWLDLDADPIAIATALSDDPLIGPLLAATPGLRVLGYADTFEGATMAVIGQQVSLAATRTFGGRLVAAFGTRIGDGYAVYPTAETLAVREPREVQSVVGLTRARANTVVSLARAFAGGLTLDAGADPNPVRAELLAITGIGPWTVDYLSVRALGDRDAFVPGDLVLRRALRVKTAGEATALSEAWRPYRAYALFHLWTDAAYQGVPAAAAAKITSR